MQMSKRKRKSSNAQLRGLRNVSRYLQFSPETSPVKSTEISPRKNKKSLAVSTRLSPCMASDKGKTIGGISGNRNRHTKRTTLEIFTRRKRQRERIVSGLREIDDNDQEALNAVNCMCVSCLLTMCTCLCVHVALAQDVCMCCQVDADCHVGAKKETTKQGNIAWTVERAW